MTSTDTTAWTVGDGATVVLYTDRHAYTVIKVTAKTITIQRDKAIADPGWTPDFTPGGFLGHTSNDRDRAYTYEADPEGGTLVARLTKTGWRTGGRRVLPGRHEFYDSNF